MASLITRNGIYYLQWYAGRKIRRRSLQTSSVQIAKDKLRQFESARLRGIDDPLPTRTPIPDVVAAYVQHIRQVKTPKSAQTDVYYLREMFGPICPALEITARKVTEACRKRPRKPSVDRRRKVQRIEAPFFEAITTRDVAHFIGSHTRTRGLAPKTANRYREIVVRLFNWAMKQHGIRMPGDKNPAATVERYKERAPEIRDLTLAQIDEQLAALVKNSQLQAMVATLIYAGLRREELDKRAGSVGLIHIRAKTVRGESWQPKTKQNRSVPVSTNLRHVLDRYASRPSLGGWYFPSPEGVRHDPDNSSRELRAKNRIAGQPWACLDFRHTFGSQLAQNGLSLYKISHLMGNSPEICRRHYAALVPEAMTDELEFTKPVSGGPRMSA